MLIIVKREAATSKATASLIFKKDSPWNSDIDTSIGGGCKVTLFGKTAGSPRWPLKLKPTIWRLARKKLGGLPAVF